MSTSRLNTRKDAGLTLVELLVAIAITSIIMAISIGIFISQYKSYRASNAVKTSQAGSQKAIDMVREDFALAGWSVKPEMAFFILDGGTGTDEIYINDASLISIESGNDTKTTNHLVKMVDGDCAGCARYTGTTVVPTSSLDIDGDGNTTEFQTVPVIIWNTDTNRATFGETNGSRNLTAAISHGLVTPAIQYSVNTTSATLRREARDTSGSQPMAEDVVDLQVVYQDDGNNTYGNSGCTTCQMTAFDASKIKRIDLSIVTRSRERTKPQQDSSSCRPASGNRPAAASGSAECGYEYRVQTTRITPYNRIR
jgi:prepilin-type N-terminal cleavage/methylation domain-containing protein